MKYAEATQKDGYVFIQVVEQTNCIDKKNGHQYEYIGKNHPEYQAITEARPALKNRGASIWKCLKCDKTTTAS